MKDERENKDRQQPAPISDGDARPDKFVDPDFLKTKKSRTANKDTAPVTTNRSADEDSRDDFRDSK